MSEEKRMSSVEVRVPINIALVKYWGKRDVALMLPLNDSFSITVDAFMATTTLSLRDAEATADEVFVNEVFYPATGTKDGRANPYKQIFDEARRLVAGKAGLDNSLFFKVVSWTNFPVGSGLASSAAGFAAIAFALGQLFPGLIAPDYIPRLGGLGSGSASRSLFGGWVHWAAGTAADGSDCRVFPVCEASADWASELRAVVVTTSAAPKAVGSSAGMAASVATSELLQRRLELIPQRILDIKAAIDARDFVAFARLVIRESNQLHAVCLDTTPPLLYHNAASHHLIRIAEAYNAAQTNVAYTFDAGPNPVFFLPHSGVPAFLGLLQFTCPSSYHVFDGLTVEDWKTDAPFAVEPSQDVIEQIVVSTIGAAPQLVSST